MKILVTGSSGFVGRHLVSYLRSRGHHVVGHRRILNENKTDLIVCDFLKNIPESSELVNFDAVIHLVGKVHDIKGVVPRSEYEILNHSSVLSFAKNCSVANVKKFIFFSTIKATNTAKKKDNALDDIYAFTKKQGEDSLIEFSKETDMEINIIRPALIYGEGVKGNLNPLVKLIKYGLCPPFPETQNRKYLIHVRDLCVTVGSILKIPLETKDIITATELKPYSTRKIMQDLRHALGKEITKYAFPYSLIKLFIKMPFGIGFKFRKLFSDDDYEIRNMGFEPKTQLTLKNIFEDVI